MPIFECSKCDCIENTALSNYWMRKKFGVEFEGVGNEPLCSECDPQIGKWHGEFDKESAVGFFLGNDGFLYHREDETPRI